MTAHSPEPRPAEDATRWRRLFEAAVEAAVGGERRLDGLLLTGEGDVAAVSGFGPAIEVGANPFAWLNGAALLWPDDALLVVPNLDAGAAAAANLLPRLESYEGYRYEAPFAHRANLSALVLAELTAHLPARGGRLGIDAATLPFALAEAIRERFPGMVLVDVTERLAWARAVKDEAEIARLRRSFAVADAMHSAVRALVRPGLREIELWSAVKGVAEREVGERVPLYGDLLAGPRTAESGGFPGDRPLEAGDLVMADLVPRVAAYWADTCSATVVGEPDAGQGRVSGLVREALARGIEAVRPGVTPAELDALLRRELARHGFTYPHHSGHGVGTTLHDEPRIVPYERRPLAAGMVITLEPGAYLDGWGGIRWEVGLVVRDGGPEVLSGFSLDLG